MKKRSIIAALIFIVLTLSLAMLLPSCSDDENASTGIVSAEIKDGNTVTVKASLDASYTESHSKGTVYLLALDSMTPDKSLANAENVGESKVKGSMTFKLSLYNAFGDSRVASAFVLAEKNGESYSALTDPYYISNPDSVASKSEGGNSSGSMKGIESNDAFGALSLGASQMLIDVRMDRLILEDYTDGAVKFNYNGITYFYNSKELEALDKLIEDADAASMKIYLRALLSYGEYALDDGSTAYPPEFLYFKGAKGADSYLPDMTNEKTVRYIKAFYAFTASRYPVSEFIIGENANCFAQYNNAGKLTSEEYEVMYSYYARVAYQALRSTNSKARIHIPTDSTWRTDSNASKIGAKVFLSRFADSARKGGDYGFGIALNLGAASDLSALLSGKGYDYSNIGVTNLQDLKNFAETAEMKYNSERRHLMIDGLELSTDISEKNRAAYYTFAYYAAAENGIDAFILSSDVYSADGKRSDMYYAMLMCGSSMYSQLEDYTAKLPEVHVPDFSAHVSKKLTYAQSPAASVADSVIKNKKSLPIGIGDLSAAGGVYNLQGMYAEDGIIWHIDSNPSLGTGAVCVREISAEDIISSGYVGITASSETSSRLALLLSSQNGAAAYIGETDTEVGETTYYFDINSFIKNVSESDKLTLAICILPDGDGNDSVDIKELALYGSSQKGIETVIIIAIVAVVLAVMAALIILLVIRRKKKAAARASKSDG